MNVNAVNYNNAINAGNVGLTANTESKRAKHVAAAFENQIYAAGQPMNSTDVSKNFLSVIGEGLTSVEDALKVDAQIAKDNLKALFNKLSGPEAAAMDADGFCINDMDSEEILTVVDRIKIMLATYCEDYQLISGDIDMEQIKEVVGDAGLAAKVSSKLSENYIPPTEENIMQVVQADEMASKLPETLNENVQRYLMKNDMEPTIANVYKAQHASAHSDAAPLADEEWNQLLPQADRIIEKAGMAVNTENRAMARQLVEWEVELTPENLEKISVLQHARLHYSKDQVISDCVNAMSEGRSPMDVRITGEGTPSWKTASEAVKVIQNATEKDVERATVEYGSFTIAALSMSQVSVQGYIAANLSVEVRQKVIVNNRTLNEARLALTAYSGKALLDSGIDIFNEDLKKITEILSEAEKKFVIEDLSDKNAGSVSKEDLDRVSGFEAAVRKLMFMPSAAIGIVMSAHIKMSVESLNSEGGNLQRRYEQAGLAYDTMSTKVRSDMGDNLRKAVETSAESILEAAGMENSPENVRAVRILAASGMEVTPGGLLAVKNYDLQINEIMDRISPQTVLDMIRQDINPLTMEIGELHSYMQEVQQDVTEEIERFSEFLYDLDRQGDITANERQRYIGVYKMFNMFRKDNGKAIGALINQGADLTLGNMLTAIKSARRDIDARLDANAGMAEVIGRTQYFTSLFASLSGKITPSMLKNSVKETKKEDIDEVTLEELAKSEGDSTQERAALTEYYREELGEMNHIFQSEENMIRMLTDYEIPVTFHNMMAAEGLLKRPGKLFEQLLEQDDSEDIREDIDGLAESMESGEKMKEAYDKLSADVQEKVRGLLSGENTTNLDLKGLRTLTQGIRLAAAMSDHQDYVIPFETEDGVGIINVRLIHDEDNRGKIRMNLDYADGQKKYLECSAQGSRLDIFLAENKGGDVTLPERLTEGLRELGYEDIHISHVQNDETINAGRARQNGTPTARLYQTAKILIKNLCRTT